jgi:uncharacterized membrane protein YraQ (UPF0718 family)
MKKLTSIAIAIFTALVIGFYTSFVFQNLWNWFLAPALHLDPISYWVMYGVSMLIRAMLSSRQDETIGHLWEQQKQLLELCVPDANRSRFHSVLKEEEENMWALAGAAAFGEFLGSTISLGFGWLIHTFLA